MKKLIMSLIITTFLSFFFFGLIYENKDNFVYAFEAEKIFTEDADDEVQNGSDDKSDTGKDDEKNLDNLVQTALSAIDFSALEELISTVQNEYQYNFAQSFYNLIQNVITGDSSFGLSEFFDLFADAFFIEFKNILPMMLSIIMLSVLYGILQNMSDRLNNGSIKKVIFMAIWGVIVVIIVFLVSKSIISLQKSLNFYATFIDVVFPILITIMTLLGGSFTVGIYQPLVLVFSQLIFKIIQLVILPLFYASFVFMLVSGFSGNNFTQKLSKTAKSAANWIIGIVFSLFITITTAQGITGASFDSLAVRGAKYALSSYVPVLGDYLSQGFDLVMASFVVVKNAVGLSAVILVVFMTIFPLIKILIISFGFKLLGAVIEPIGGKKLSDMMTDTASCLMLLVVILIAVAFSVFIILMLIIYSCNRGL